jgi:Rod binding domain-containing protein
MSIAALQSSNDVGGQSIESLARNPTVSEKDKLRRATQEFEAYLLRTYLAEARKPVVSSKCNPDSGSSDIYQSLITGQLADGISRSGTLGLSTLLQQQIERQNGGLLPDAGKAASPPVSLEKTPS